MIRGMTGFGQAPVRYKDIKGVVEIKAQNHRYLDINFYFPVGFGALEERLRRKLTRVVLRGRVVVSLKILERPLLTVEFNQDAASRYQRYAQQLSRQFGMDPHLRAGEVLRFPGVVETREVWLDPEDLWPGIDRAVGRALKAMLAMRKREGRALYNESLSLLQGMTQKIRAIRKRAQAIWKSAQKRLTPEELTSFQKGTDVQEELTRLDHYVSEYRLLLKTAASVGKRLDFVAQEMQRETNTIGAKLQDKTVTQAVVVLKSQVEKLREQAQNIE